VENLPHELNICADLHECFTLAKICARVEDGAGANGYTCNLPPMSIPCCCGCGATGLRPVQQAASTTGWEMIFEASDLLLVVAVVPQVEKTEEFREDGLITFDALCSVAHDTENTLPARPPIQEAKRWMKFSKKVRKTMRRQIKKKYGVDPFKALELSTEQKVESRLWIEEGTMPSWVKYQRQQFFLDE
jgi:hypothetical protein